MSRFWLWLWLVLAGSLLLPQSTPGSAATSAGLEALAVAEMVGEQHAYALDFLFLTRLASGELSLSATAQPDVFVAELVGRTQGLAARLTGDRTQRYVSRMQLMADGRLRSLAHESRIIRRKWGQWRNSGKRYTFDHAKGRVYLERVREERSAPGEMFVLPEGTEPVDILTAFYNLRAGVYGAVVPGASLRIPTFAKQAVNEIRVEVLTARARQDQPFFPADGVLLQVHADPEVFETGDGELYVWFSPDGIPEKGIVKGLLGMGDVRGYQEKGQP